MAAERLADDLWLLPGRPRYAVNVYVIGDVLVDAATRHSAARILRDMRGLPVRAHALTHAHMDHMGASHEICDKLGIPFMCGRGDVVTAESGGRDTLASAPLPLRLEHRAIAGPGHPVSRVLDEGDQLAGFSVLEVPGHAPGHLAFWRARDRTLVPGD